MCLKLDVNPEACENCIFSDVCGYAKTGNVCKDFILAPAKRQKEEVKKRAYVPPKIVVIRG